MPSLIERLTSISGRSGSKLSVVDARDCYAAATALAAQEAETEKLRAQMGMTLGVGGGGGKLFVHGDYDSIKAAQAWIFRAEKAEAENARLVEALSNTLQIFGIIIDDMDDPKVTARHGAEVIREALRTQKDSPNEG